MERNVFVQPVGIEVGLDRRLHRGDSLIVESRAAVRDGELVVAEGDVGPCVGRYEASARELVLYPLETAGAPSRVRREDVHVRGVVIGVKTAL